MTLPFAPADAIPPVERAVTPPHQWTHDGNRVLLLKCVGANRESKGGFVWPASGPVMPAVWSRKPDCDSGGLFGWPWGLGRGGKEPLYRDALWIVFAAHPDDVIGVETDGLCDKAKAVPNPETGQTPEVLYCGPYAGALALILEGQVAWIQLAANGAASATGGRGAASATGWRGAASATGERGAASATGERGAAVVTGEYSTVEAGPTGVAVAMAEDVTWIVTEGAVFLQRWPGGHVLLTAADIGAKTGDRVRIVRGVRQ